MSWADVLQIWWILPASACISAAAIACGISGALFFSPLFLLALGLEPAEAIGAGLITQLFGTSFGTINYVRQKVVDYTTAKLLLIPAVPAAIAGSFLARYIAPNALQITFGVALIALASILIYNSTRKSQIAEETTYPDAEKIVIRAKDGAVFTYRSHMKRVSSALAAVGGLLTGLISAGLPEITTTNLIIWRKVPPRVAVATAIFVVMITGLFIVGIHALNAKSAWNVIVWSVPGVMIGAQFGPRIQKKIPPNTSKLVLGILFVMVGLLVILTRVLG
ncbi:MAG: sulfite exporter TauE/SafE family protein [Chloroflexi bacterium]|nr:sulfite exporter TauE/SafE family protein [Chloroflexota bacterium]MBT7080410.1 sulfite exporter TauE/SafE family protein [Chloroflexota bacterium]MBT7289241.1 sulfite exporter TauE/SafE family protein [Chloroflexota bacterium]